MKIHRETAKGQIREVTLTELEKRAQDFHRALLDQGLSTPQAVVRTQEVYPGLDPGFYRYIGQ